MCVVRRDAWLHGLPELNSRRALCGTSLRKESMRKGPAPLGLTGRKSPQILLATKLCCGPLPALTEASQALWAPSTSSGLISTKPEVTKCCCETCSRSRHSSRPHLPRVSPAKRSRKAKGRVGVGIDGASGGAGVESGEGNGTSRHRIEPPGWGPPSLGPWTTAAAPNATQATRAASNAAGEASSRIELGWQLSEVGLRGDNPELGSTCCLQ